MGHSQPHIFVYILFVYIFKSLAFKFYSEHVETKEIILSGIQLTVKQFVSSVISTKLKM